MVRHEFGRRPVPVLPERCVEGPVVLGDEVLDFPLPIHDEGQGGTLHPTHGEEIPTELV